MQKKDFLSSLIFLASLDFKLFLSFFIETLACHLPWTMCVALITAADGVYHPTSAALIIGRQGRRSIYPDRSESERENRPTRRSILALEDWCSTDVMSRKVP